MSLNFTSWTLQIKYCRRFTHTARWNLDKTWADYTLYLIHSGSMSVTVNGETHCASEGSAVLLLPGDHGRIAADSECEYLLVCFWMDVGNYHHLLFRLNSAGIYEGLPAEPVFAAFAAGEANPLRFTPKQYAAFSLFLAELMEQPHRPFHKAVPQYSDWKLNQLLSRMAEACPKSLPIRELAAEMEMSEKYFIRFFRTQLGCTPGQYMNRQRMEYAAQLLSDHTLSLEETAQRLCYADAYSFSKAFRKYYGEPPGAFREHSK